MPLKKLKFSERVIDYFIQAIFIFISVFLAFWLNNYQAKQENIRLTKNVKNTIYQELSNNLRSLEKSETYHAVSFSKATNFLKTKLDTITYFSRWEMADTSQPMIYYTLSNGAANLAMDSRVHINAFEKSRISLIYEEQKRVNKAHNKLYREFLTSRERYDNEKVRENYLINYHLLDNLWTGEKVLIANMKDVIKHINN